MRPAAALLLLALPALAGEPLTLVQALRQAGSASLPAESARLSLAAAREDEARARSPYWPDLQVQGGYRLLDERPGLISQPISLGAMQLGPFTTPPVVVPPQVFPTEDRHAWQYRISLQYLVWDFGRRDRALAAARAGVAGTGFQGGAEVRRAQGEAAARYVALLDLEAQRRVLRQRRTALEGHRAAVQALFEHGVVARNDLLRTEVALRRVEDADRALDAAGASAREALNLALGRPAAEPLALPGDLAGPPELPWDEAACRAKAAEANDTVRALAARVRALEQRTSALRRDRLPVVVAEASHTYAQNPYLAHEHENALFLGLSWKVFDGGGRRARADQSEAESARARRELLEARRQAESGAATAFRAYRQALREADTAGTNARAAEENLRIVNDQYAEGLLRTIDVLDAESVLAESRSAQAERRYRAFAQQAALLALLGEDLPAFYERKPSAPEP